MSKKQKPNSKINGHNLEMVERWPLSVVRVFRWLALSAAKLTILLFCHFLFCPFFRGSSLSFCSNFTAPTAPWGMDCRGNVGGGITCAGDAPEKKIGLMVPHSWDGKKWVKTTATDAASKSMVESV